MSVAKSGGLLKAVFDTNVYFSAFSSPRGVPSELWRRAARGDFVLIVSRGIVTELADVLRRDIKRTESEIMAQLKRVARVAKIVEPRFTLDVVTADHDDDRILECAVAGKADLIVSYDHHLTDLKAFQGIGIVRPVDFLRILGTHST